VKVTGYVMLFAPLAVVEAIMADGCRRTASA